MRKLFGTDGIRGIANTYPITAEVALKVGKAAAAVFSNDKGRSKIIIGKDTRISGYMIENALTAGITSVGVDVFLVGPMPTPAIAHLTKSFAADAGIVISASHNPAQDNGIKFFSSDGFKLADEVEEKIEELVFSEEIKTEHIRGNRIGKAYRIDDARGRYIEFAKNSINNISLEGIKIVLDCANGAAYKIASYIFSELGAEVIVLNNQPNGLNINLNCGALHPEFISKKMVEEKADVGIALDGDADRVIFVDEYGKEINGDRIMAMLALNMLKKGKLAKKTLVATDYSNLGLDEAITKAGGRVVRVENGDRYVIGEMRKHGYNLGGEQSGHIIFGDYSTTGDGMIVALQVLRLMKERNQKISELAKCMQEFPQILINVEVKEKKPFDELPVVMETIKNSEELLGSEGRVFVRYSGTQMIARVLVEGKDKQQIQKLAEEIAEAIKKEVGK